MGGWEREGCVFCVISKSDGSLQLRRCHLHGSKMFDGRPLGVVLSERIREADHWRVVDRFEERLEGLHGLWPQVAALASWECVLECDG